MMNKPTVSGGELLEYIQDLHQAGWEGVPYQDREAILEYPQWVLVKARIQDLKAGSHHPPVATEYSKRKTNLPPIVVNDEGFILDGVHRYHAAKLRKQKMILAYVPSHSSGLR